MQGASGLVCPIRFSIKSVTSRWKRSIVKRRCQLASAARATACSRPGIARQQLRGKARHLFGGIDQNSSEKRSFAGQSDKGLPAAPADGR